MQRFTGKIALVTGARRTGIGQAIALRLASEGAVVAVNRKPDLDAGETPRDDRKGSRSRNMVDRHLSWPPSVSTSVPGLARMRNKAIRQDSSSCPRRHPKAKARTTNTRSTPKTTNVPGTQGDGDPRQPRRPDRDRQQSNHFASAARRRVCRTSQRERDPRALDQSHPDRPGPARQEDWKLPRADIDQEIETVAQRYGISREGWLRTLDKERNISPVQYARDIIYPALALRKLCSGRVRGHSRRPEERRSRPSTARSCAVG